MLTYQLRQMIGRLQQSHHTDLCITVPIAISNGIDVTLHQDVVLNDLDVWSHRDAIVNPSTSQVTDGRTYCTVVSIFSFTSVTVPKTCSHALS